MTYVAGVASSAWYLVYLVFVRRALRLAEAEATATTGGLSAARNRDQRKAPFMDSQQKLQARFSLIYAVGAVLAVLLLQEYVIGPMMANEEEVPYSQFRQDLAGRSDRRGHGRTGTNSLHGLRSG